MATIFRITVWTKDEAPVNAAVDEAFQEIARLNAIFSDYEPWSEISRLSRTHDKAVPVSDDLWRILVRGREIARGTDGAFDFTCGHLSHLWRRAIRLKKPPPPARLEQGLELTDWRSVELDEPAQTANLTKEGTLLDLGGIAKGYAADAALRILAGHSLPISLITAGGDLACGSPPPRSQGWDVHLRTRESGTEEATIQVHHSGVSTSGDLHQFVEIDGVRYSHIVSPKTGLGLTNRIAATVVAPDTTTSDALATALCVSGEALMKDVVQRFPGVSARLVRQTTDGNETHTSPGFPPQ